MKYYLPLSLVVIIGLAIALSVSIGNNTDSKARLEQLEQDNAEWEINFDRFVHQNTMREDTIQQLYLIISNQKTDLVRVETQFQKEKAKLQAIKFVSLGSDSARAATLKELYPTMK